MLFLYFLLLLFYENLTTPSLKRQQGYFYFAALLPMLDELYSLSLSLEPQRMSMKQE